MTTKFIPILEKTLEKFKELEKNSNLPKKFSMKAITDVIMDIINTSDVEKEDDTLIQIMNELKACKESILELQNENKNLKEKIENLEEEVIHAHEKIDSI